MTRQHGDRHEAVREKIWTIAYVRALRELPPQRAEQEGNRAVAIYQSHFDPVLDKSDIEPMPLESICEALLRVGS